MAYVYGFEEKLPKKLPVSSYDIEEIFFTKNFHPLKGKNSVDTKQNGQGSC